MLGENDGGQYDWECPPGPDDEQCDHGVTFDAEAARGLAAREVRERWPRGFGPCPKGCGFTGIAYASFKHYISGDW